MRCRGLIPLHFVPSLLIYRAGDDVCWKLCGFPSGVLRGRAICLSAIASTTLRAPSCDSSTWRSPVARVPDLEHLEAISCSFPCRVSGSLFDCRVSDEFNFHRQRPSCGAPSVSRSTSKRFWRHLLSLQDKIRLRISTLLMFESDSCLVLLRQQLGRFVVRRTLNFWNSKLFDEGSWPHCLLRLSCILDLSGCEFLHVFWSTHWLCWKR